MHFAQLWLRKYAFCPTWLRKFAFCATLVVKICILRNFGCENMHFAQPWWSIYVEPPHVEPPYVEPPYVEAPHVEPPHGFSCKFDKICKMTCKLQQFCKITLQICLNLQGDLAKLFSFARSGRSLLLGGAFSREEPPHGRSLLL